MSSEHSSTSVIICAYSDDRYEQTLDATESVLAQEPPPLELLLVVDHNPALQERLTAAFPGDVVMASSGPRGLSGARNTGVARARGALVAFLDDDATARPGWLAAMEAAAADPAVMAVGGLAIPAWQAGAPAWFPLEYLWVVGCSYEGQNVGPTMRNPIGCNMAIRRAAFEAAGDFHTAVGRVGTVPVGAEETELSLRIRAALPGSRVAFARDAVVDHQVPAGRGTIGYFLRRSYHEGASKAILSRLAASHVGDEPTDALRAERAYMRRTLPKGVFRQLRRIRTLADVAPAAAGAIMIVAGVAAAAVGFGLGKLRMMTNRAATIK